MEISNKALGLACASIVLLAIAVKTQESPTVQAIVPDSQAQAGRPIPDSDFALVNQYGRINEPTEDLGTPNKALITQNQAGAIVPGVTHVVSDQPIVVQQQASQPPSMGDLGSTTVDSSGNLTDTSRLDPILDSMSDEDQAGFWMMWDTMSPEQRQKLVSRMGG